ncbi:TPA: HlyD family efflux transporter periplasmic adaptor subunit [Pseudomonas putida]|uniref:HlyD family efflux transporter periplasmic adaptor subunit n=1 Tax=Pseudomonas putida TaxID=303 RepID=UPI0023643B46|nr:HlyD family efflux transporter periplasmic adaptor subunit [Pseudomonas putida]MDD2152156.1 HlyD family efflux transporter periplasmic adaptor subunit [Pseudomonas putida]HDS1679034.1 HlyD family efflux transporter periplasmic adaptor subunit [Pseudomonas putida]
MKKPLIAICILAVLAVGGWAWWQQHDKGGDGALVLHGNVDIRQISLAFDGSGRVAELRADEGDSVKAGTVLGVLDTRTLALQAEQATAQIEVQQQNLLRMRNGSRPEEVTQARSRLTAAQADASRTQQDLARLQGIATSTQGRGVSAQDLDRAKSNVQVATAQVEEKREALRLTQLGPRKEDVAGAEAQLKASQAQRALLEHQIAQGDLKAPSDAVVRSRLLEPGDMATPQRPVFALALMQPKWVRVYVNEPDLGQVKPGMEARVVTDSQPDQPIAGKVGYISSVAEFTPKSVQTEELRTSLVYEVRVLVEDPQNVLRLGQPATVHLTADTAQ